MKKAIIVGITDYNGKYGSLPGCVTDMQEWSDILTNKYDFKPENVRLLSNNRATKSEILSRLEWLFSDKLATHLVFCFAGHGARIRRRDYDTGDLADQLDEALVAYPASKDEDIQKHLIYDDDLCDIVNRYSGESKAAISLIFDSCHSGGMLRDVLGGDAPLPRAIEIPPDVSFRELSAINLTTRRIGELANVDVKHVICAAALDVESAWDARMEDGNRHGVFTFHATRALANNPNLTFRELIDATKQKVSQKFPQHPDLLGSNMRFQSQFLS
ncbi:MAG: caspase family protein [Candidatus Saccharibacteria bacterium]|nr:caspase family protein [Candidatus Saccharibacteria bacterium]